MIGLKRCFRASNGHGYVSLGRLQRGDSYTQRFPRRDNDWPVESDIDKSWQQRRSGKCLGYLGHRLETHYRGKQVFALQYMIFEIGIVPEAHFRVGNQLNTREVDSCFFQEAE